MTNDPTTSSPPVLVQDVCFHAFKAGFETVGRESRMIEDVSAQITAWLNAQGRGVNVLHIALSETTLAAHGVVWFTPASGG